MCRLLEADEIEVRVQSLRENKEKEVLGAVLLLYKNARTDMDYLDRVYGKLGWQRKHEFKNGILYCTVSVWDEEKKQWISREDVGTESYAEAEKGRASDAFKRASTLFGSGRELYSAPSIIIKADGVSTYKDNKGNNKTSDRFIVTDIAYDEKNRISSLVIFNEKLKKTVYTYKANANHTPSDNNNVTRIQGEANNSLKNGSLGLQMTLEQALAHVVEVEIANGMTVKDLYNDKEKRKLIPSIYEQGGEATKKALEIAQAEIVRKRTAQNEGQT